ncbi:hypothetical protein [Candidatus Albibeggiatoa sp. nov. BB20]|uniref:hypothetical protein n=1 Tax=Candidatus Albibeggiatoa sp. nov. BB20 TaxID=3162723 RepID=UPI0033652F3B
MKHLLYILVALLSTPLSFADELGNSTDLKPIELLVTVKYIDVENGFYGFETIDGQKFLPTNIPDSFKRDQLPIKVFGVRQPHIVGIHQWGEYIRIMSIQVIDCAEANEDEQAVCDLINIP